MISIIFFLLFIFLSFYFFFKSYFDLLSFFSFVMPYSIFAKVGSININSTEFLLVLIILLYPFKNKRLDLTFPYLLFILFILFSFIATIINGSVSEMSILFFRFFLYVMLILIFHKCLDSYNKIKSIITSVFYGYLVFSIILVFEFIYLYIISGSTADGAIGWKIIIGKLGFYPQTVSENQILGWSSLGSLTGIFTVHHSLAIYLGCIFFFFLGSNFNSYLIKKYRLFLLTTTLFFILLTNSRFIILSLILILLYHFRFYFFKNKIKLFLLLCILILVYNVGNYNRFYAIYFTVSQISYILTQNFNNFNVISDYLFEYSNEFASDSSSSYRLLYNFNSFRLIFEYPFFGSGNLGLNLIGSEKANPHSLYLIFLQRFGFISFAFFICFIILIFKRSKQFIRDNDIMFGLSSFYVFLFFIFVSFGIFTLSDLRTCYIFLLSIVLISKKNLLLASKNEILC